MINQAVLIQLHCHYVICKCQIKKLYNLLKFKVSSILLTVYINVYDLAAYID